MSVCSVYVLKAHVALCVHWCTGVCNCKLSGYLVILFSFCFHLWVLSLFSHSLYMYISHSPHPPSTNIWTSEGSGAADGVTPWGAQQTAWPSARRDQWETEDHRRLKWVSAIISYLFWPPSIRVRKQEFTLHLGRSLKKSTFFSKQCTKVFTAF